MRVAIFGGNATAHFLAQKLLLDESVEMVYHVNANASIQPNTRYSPMRLSEPNTLTFLRNTDLDLVVATTLVYIIWAPFQRILANRNIPRAHVTGEHGILEWSKIEGKNLLNALDIPTAKHTIYNKTELLNAYDSIPRPFILKFERDWRAGLQTLMITDENYQEEAKHIFTSGQRRHTQGMGVDDFVQQKFIVEEIIPGVREYSYHAISSGSDWKYIGSARDYKKFEDGDLGFNTAGMGCYAPVNINPKVHEYAEKIFKYYEYKGKPYRGFLYLGIMEDAEGNPYVLEINTRPGDPEFQTIFSILDESISLVDLLMSIATGSKLPEINFSDKSAVAVRIVNKNYRSFIDSKDDVPEIEVHPDLWPIPPGVVISYNRDRRQLNSVIVTTGNTIDEAREKIYKFLENKTMHNFTYRKDIGSLK